MQTFFATYPSHSVGLIFDI